MKLLRTRKNRNPYLFVGHCRLVITADCLIKMQIVVEVSLWGSTYDDKVHFAEGNLRGVSRTYIEFTTPY